MEQTKIVKNKLHELTATDRTVFGFWVYLMTDLVMFGVLFATYTVLNGNTANGPTPRQIFNLPYVLLETFVLLTSSFTAGLAMFALRNNNKTQTLIWLALTFLLGLTFLVLELTEFNRLISEGDSWQRSGFLSGYFTLVGTHGLHITVGLCWILLCGMKIRSQGLTASLARKLTLWSLFWHFLDIVWIFIFSIVYLIPVL